MSELCEVLCDCTINSTLHFAISIKLIGEKLENWKKLITSGKYIMSGKLKRNNIELFD